MLSRLALCGALLSCAFAQQDLGELRLGVQDPASAPIAATAELVNLATKTHQSVVLPPEGRYVFKYLPFGTYRLSVSRTNFTPSVELLEIRSAIPRQHEVTLRVAPVGTAVVVSEAATLMDPDRSASTYYVGAKDVRERQPTAPGRDLVDLVARQPGWILEANGVLHPRESEYETQYIVNGFPVEDNRSPAFAPSMEADDVQALKIYTSGIPAEFGRKVGGVIEVTTDRNSSPGFHGAAVLQGGSFATAGGYLSGQWVAGRTTASLSAESFLTDRYLDPPVQLNFTNHASSAAFTATLERDFNDSGRLRVSASHRENHFLVPNELIQETAAQRQDRGSDESEGQVSYQVVFSPKLLGALRGMVRDLAASLWSNPLATPISAQQDRGFREGYFSANLSGHNGRQEWKAGADARFASLRESFVYAITAYGVNGVPLFDPDTPPSLSFAGRAQDREQSAYAQDSVRLGAFTLNGGVRLDHYHLLVEETAVSPRAGLSWNSTRLGLVLHASYDRIFGTPAFENILVSAWAGALALNDNALYLPLRPSHGNYYEAGFAKALFGRLRLDASYFRRDITNYADDDLLLNTGVSFPIAFHRAEIRGAEVKLDLPRWGPFSGSLSYSNMIGIGQFPIAGGLFLDDSAPQLLHSTDRFPVSQDQRNTARASLRYQIAPRLWTSWSASYNSGLPVDSLGQSLDFLAAQYGAAVVGQVNFDRGRVRPAFSLDASIGAELWRKEKRSISAQASVLNLADRLNVINFAGLLSGTAIAPPRSFGLRLRAEF
jgi:hypothetical protein